MHSALAKRSNQECEICQAHDTLSAYYINDSPDTSVHSHVYVCPKCITNIEATHNIDLQHLRCLITSMWSTTAAVQVMSYRLLHKCLPESWAQDALDMVYLEDDLIDWAQAGLHPHRQPTFDVNGAKLLAGDSVTIIKDLDVKGANFTAKRGTPVRNIGLSENPLQIEGKVNGTRIVIIAAYTKKN